ncbi:ABC transporter G family member 53 [Senna tora]|uniref:ABC transporter G family member 53 n=1 Tax=Senna tora TaxID=362788 RepID=A0A834TX06_9FABA|nr:ABC transporter G family member 53 [Senna tora]
MTVEDHHRSTVEDHRDSDLNSSKHRQLHFSSFLEQDFLGILCISRTCFSTTQTVGYAEHQSKEKTDGGGVSLSCICHGYIQFGNNCGVRGIRFRNVRCYYDMSSHQDFKVKIGCRCGGDGTIGFVQCLGHCMDWLLHNMAM